MTTPRTTQNARAALHRLIEATGWEHHCVGTQYALHTPGDKEKPILKTSARALAFLVSSVRHRADWEALRTATAYDPGTARDGRPDVPTHGLSSWEEMELRRLALTH